jgi:GNAT superfamily N-acetyltransferase
MGDPLVSLPPAVGIEFLADHPALIPAIGQLRYDEWGAASQTGLAGWTAITAREAGRAELPITWVALADNGEALGAAGLQPGSDLAGRSEFCPAVVGVIVAPGYRGLGIGRRLLTAIAQWAQEHGRGPLYVVTGDTAVGFYRQCGWGLVEETTITGPDTQATERVNVLRRSVGASG